MPPIRKLLGPRTLLLVSIGYTLTISVAFLIPGKDIPPTTLPIDKLVHIGLHAVLLFLWLAYSFRKVDFQIKRRRVILIAIICLAYGMIIEVLQEHFVSLRYADVWDIVANSIGLLLGILVFYKSRKYFENQN